MLNASKLISNVDSSAIVPDGGIIKLPIIDSTDSKPIQWRRGVKALFHYSAHAYLPPNNSKSVGKADCKDSHTHSHGCSHHTKSDINDRVTLINDLLDRSKETAEQKAKRKSEYYSEESDIQGEPIRKLISNSRDRDSKPFELRIGYSFSVVAMELGIKTMKVGEKARFLCMPKYCEVKYINHRVLFSLK